MRDNLRWIPFIIIVILVIIGLIALIFTWSPTVGSENKEEAAKAVPKPGCDDCLKTKNIENPWIDTNFRSKVEDETDVYENALLSSPEENGTPSMWVANVDGVFMEYPNYGYLYQGDYGQPGIQVRACALSRMGNKENLYIYVATPGLKGVWNLNQEKWKLYISMGNNIHSGRATVDASSMIKGDISSMTFVGEELFMLTDKLIYSVNPYKEDKAIKIISKSVNISSIASTYVPNISPLYLDKNGDIWDNTDEIKIREDLKPNNISKVLGLNIVDHYSETFMYFLNTRDNISTYVVGKRDGKFNIYNIEGKVISYASSQKGECVYVDSQGKIKVNCLNLSSQYNLRTFKTRVSLTGNSHVNVAIGGDRAYIFVTD